MIEIGITPSMLENATRLAREMGSLKNSIEGVRSNLVGFLGEECLVKHYINKKKCTLSRVNNFDYDFILNGYKIEVKSKETAYPPTKNFTVNINSFNPHQEKQEVDFYFFVSILQTGLSFNKGFLLGYMAKKEFLKRATFFKKGDRDGESNFYFKHDCLCLKVSELSELCNS